MSDVTHGHQPSAAGLSRRELLKSTGRIAAAGALAGVALPQFVHAAASDAIQLALVGCGGRGTGAAADAMSNTSGPTKLVAMADVFPHRLINSYEQIKPKFDAQVTVTEDKKFIGFDGYKHAMDALKPGDVVILTTPPAFRWVHFNYAIQKGLNVFMEKPITVDGPSTRKMLALGEEAKKKNLKVGVGLMCRHCEVRGELFKRIQGGEIGDLMLLRAYRMAGPTAHAFALPNPDPSKMSDLLYQIQEFHAFLWASGGAYSDFLIHNIDECCWMKNDWPVEAKSSGGRHYRGDYIDQNFDTYSTEFVFADGARMYLEGRTIEGCHQEFASYAHGTKGSAVISSAGHAPSRARMFKGQIKDQNINRKDIIWQGRPDEPNPYQLEWNDLISAIVNDQPYSEVERGAKASLVTAMGRMAAHTGRIVTFDEILNSEHEFAPEVDKLTFESPAPLKKLPNGKYPVPQPGLNTKREF
ncbi:MAG: Gfo/Idh/MocA family protein [Planctomycetales bacterium]